MGEGLVQLKADYLLQRRSVILLLLTVRDSRAILGVQSGPHSYCRGVVVLACAISAHSAELLWRNMTNAVA